MNLSEGELCSKYRKVGVLARPRVLEALRQRSISTRQCAPAYRRCVNLGIAEGSSAFNNCLTQTANALSIKREMRELRKSFEKESRRPRQAHCMDMGGGMVSCTEQ